MSWFDAQLPGGAAPLEIEAPADEDWLGSFDRDEEIVGGWLVEPSPLGWPTSDPAVAEASAHVIAFEPRDVWERTVLEERDTGIIDVPQGGPAVTARLSIDPLAGSDAPSIEVPAQPVGRLLLPGSPKRDT